MTERKHLAYICAPFRGDVKQNIERAKEYARYVYELGYIPVTPHVMFPFLEDDNPAERESAMQMDLELLSKCDVIYFFDEISEGMEKEIAFAREKKIALYMGDVYVPDKRLEKFLDEVHIQWLRKEAIDNREVAKDYPDLAEIFLKDAEMFDRIADRLERVG
ncbi:DUF4406 domain-containing protein [Aerococcaceae bacterium NML130460]|nr:DUF4406 domain-containing protein [Aerococcaceae bacterium NML130460]